MPKITLSKDKIEGRTGITSNGIYEFILEGFKPKMATSKTSTNLRPSMKVINNSDPKLNGVYMPWFNANTSADWLLVDFLHALGVDLNPNNLEFPGDFIGPDDKPEEWKYQGPLLNATGKAEVICTPATGTEKAKTEIIRFICAVPGCQHKHTLDIR